MQIQQIHIFLKKIEKKLFILKTFVIFATADKEAILHSHSDSDKDVVFDANLLSTNFATL